MNPNLNSGFTQSIAGNPCNEQFIGPSASAWRRGPKGLGRVAYILMDDGMTSPPPEGPTPATLLRAESQSPINGFSLTTGGLFRNDRHYRSKRQPGQADCERPIEEASSEPDRSRRRDPQKSVDLRDLGVEVRNADYDRPETLLDAFTGIEKLLLISAVVPGERFRQHKAVIDAAKQAGVELVGYTSVLRADTSTMLLAAEHKRTEDYLKETGLTFVFLRNGWYLENHTGGLAATLVHGSIMGCSGHGRFASASRSDYAEAAITVLTERGTKTRPVNSQETTPSPCTILRTRCPTRRIELWSTTM